MFKIFHGFHLVEAYHKNKRENRSQESSVNKRIITALILSVITLIIWNLPAGVFGIDGLTVIQQRIIAIFILATLMWITEVVPSWATSIFIMVFLLLFTSNSGIKPMVNEEQVGQLLSYKDIMSSFADPVIMLFIGGFILAIAASKTGLDTHLAHVLLKPFGTKSENVLLGPRIQTAAARRQGAYCLDAGYPSRCQPGRYGNAHRHTAQHHRNEVP